MDELKEICPLRASPLHWLSEHLNIAVVWYEQVLFPIGYTKNHISTIQTLQQYNVLYSMLNVGVAFEKTHVNYLENCNIDELTTYMQYVNERDNHLKEVFHVKGKSVGTIK